MSKGFDIRLAELADQVRALDGGEQVARALIQIAGDVDTHIQARGSQLHDPAADVSQRWNVFLNQAIDEARREGERRLASERRRLARLLASDPRWSGGYADALALLAPEED
jgi:hypothetical protein